MKRALGMIHENGFGDIKMALGTIHLIIINGFRVDARTERLSFYISFTFTLHASRFSKADLLKHCTLCSVLKCVQC